MSDILSEWKRLTLVLSALWSLRNARAEAFGAMALWILAISGVVMTAALVTTPSEVARRAEENRIQYERREHLDMLMRYRATIVFCSTVPAHVLFYLHQVPVYFSGDQEVMMAYDTLVEEENQSSARRVETLQALLLAMTEAVDGAGRLPPAPRLTPEFTPECS